VTVIDFLLRVLAAVIGTLPLALFGWYLHDRIEATRRELAIARHPATRAKALPERWQVAAEPTSVIFRDPPSASTVTERITIQAVVTPTRVTCRMCQWYADVAHGDAVATLVQHCRAQHRAIREAP